MEATLGITEPRAATLQFYGMYRIKKVPQLANWVRGAFGIYSVPIQIDPSVSTAAAE